MHAAAGNNWRPSVVWHMLCESDGDRYVAFVVLSPIDEVPITHTRDMGNVQLCILEKKNECILHAEDTYKMHSRGIYVRCTIL